VFEALVDSTIEQQISQKVATNKKADYQETRGNPNCQQQ
jgi:hypothetical protein